MKLLMIGHLIGDFYFQTDEMADKKKRSFIETARHCFYYSCAICLVLWIATGVSYKHILPAVIIGLLHFIVDSIKVIIYKNDKYKKCESNINKTKIFVIDQIIHTLILFAASSFLVIEQNMGWIPDVFEKLSKACIENPIVIFVFLFCGKPAAVIVSLVFGLIPKTIVEAEKHNDNETEKQNSAAITTEKKESTKIGSWIGILEREIILILGLLGEYEVIGFVIAAKSLARHSQFDNKAFAEKYLVGTLLSTLIAILGIVLCSIF